MYSEGEIYFHHCMGRWAINGKDITCGDVFELYCQGQWLQARMEYDHGEKQYYTIPHVEFDEGDRARYRKY